MKKLKNVIVASAVRQRRFFAAMIFLAVAFFSSGTTVFAEWSVGKYSNFGLPNPQGGVLQIITNLLNWLLLVFGFIAIIGFVISGIMYLTAAGDEDAQKKAKRAMYYSIIGVIVGLVGVVIINQVDTFLNARSQSGGGATPSTPLGPGANDTTGI